MALGTLGLAFLAGVLSILSPCVLPLLPIVLGAAASEHRMGPASLAAGVALSFVAIGLFVATVGFAVGLDGDIFRTVAAILMIGVGVVLAAVWSPCVGPTLGAASVLAAQGKSLGQVALTMIAFGVGAAAPLVAIGFVSRQALARQRNRLIAGGKAAKIALSALLIILGVMIVSGFDKRVETVLVDRSPQWLTDLTTRF